MRNFNRHIAAVTLKTLLLTATAVALPVGLSTSDQAHLGIADAFAKGPPSGVGKPEGAGKPDGAGKPESVGKPAQSDDAADDDDDNDGLALGRTAVLTVYAGGTQSYLRFSHLGGGDGRVHVRLHDADTGALLGDWESPVIPGRGALEADVADIGAAAGLGARTKAVARISAGFRGHVQHLGVSAMGGFTALSACPRLETPKRALGFVAGPGRTTTSGSVQIINGGAQARSVKLVISDAATGADVGEWTSPSVPAFASFAVTAADLAEEAGFDAALDALTLRVAGSAAQLGLAYLEGISGGVPTDLTAGCPLKGGDEMSEDDADDDADDDGEDDGDDADDDTTSG